jgi:simple sugar transport system ATP-binding protein
VRGRGLGMIFITHNVRHAYADGDRFTMLNRATTLGTFAKSKPQLGQLHGMMAGDKELQELSAELGRTV